MIMIKNVPEDGFSKNIAYAPH